MEHVGVTWGVEHVVESRGGGIGHIVLEGQGRYQKHGSILAINSNSKQLKYYNVLVSRQT